MADSPADSAALPLSSPLLSSPAPLQDTDAVSQTTALPDIADLLIRPQHKHSPRKFTSHRYRAKRCQSKSLASAERTRTSPPQASQSNSLFYEVSDEEPSFVPRTIKLKDVKQIYDQRLKFPVSPPYIPYSNGSPHSRNRSRGSPSRLLPFTLAKEPTDTSFPLIQRPRGLKDIAPLKKRHLTKASKSPKILNKQHERSSTSVDNRTSPYDIHFVQSSIRKNFRLLVDLKSSTRSELVVRKATRRKVISRQDKDQKVFKVLNSLL
jgi:hypothetical protein